MKKQMTKLAAAIAFAAMSSLSMAAPTQSVHARGVAQMSKAEMYSIIDMSRDSVILTEKCDDQKILDRARSIALSNGLPVGADDEARLSDDKVSVSDYLFWMVDEATRWANDPF